LGENLLPCSRQRKVSCIFGSVAGGKRKRGGGGVGQGRGGQKDYGTSSRGPKLKLMAGAEEQWQPCLRLGNPRGERKQGKILESHRHSKRKETRTGRVFQCSIWGHHWKWALQVSQEKNERRKGKGAEQDIIIQTAEEGFSELGGKLPHNRKKKKEKQLGEEDTRWIEFPINSHCLEKGGEAA